MDVHGILEPGNFTRNLITPDVQRILSFSKPANLARYLFPPPAEKVAITLSTSRYLLLAPAVVIIMASLARTSNTWPIRLALLPFAIGTVLRMCFGYWWDPAIYHGLNVWLGASSAIIRSFLSVFLIRFLHVSGVMGILTPGYIIFLAKDPGGVLKLNEVAPGVLAEPKSEETESSKEQSSPAPTSRTPVFPSPLAFFGNGLELITNLRGIGWKFGKENHIYVAKDTRDVTNRSVFLRQTLQSIMWQGLSLDIAQAILAHADIRHPGATMFGRGRNAAESVLISTVLTVLTMVCAMNGEHIRHAY